MSEPDIGNLITEFYKNQQSLQPLTSPPLPLITTTSTETHKPTSSKSKTIDTTTTEASINEYWEAQRLCIVASYTGPLCCICGSEGILPGPKQSDRPILLKAKCGHHYHQSCFEQFNNQNTIESSDRKDLQSNFISEGLDSKWDGRCALCRAYL